MKRKIVFIVSVLLLSANMIAQTYYGMIIARVKVTTENASNITGEGISGTISYDSQTNTLTLRDATIETDTIGLSHYVDGLIINLEGDNTINATKSGISLGKHTIISGNGSLTVKSKEDSGIYLRIFSLTIKGGCTVITSGRWGIAGVNGNYDEALTIENSTVKAAGSDGSICDIAELNLINSVIRQPVGSVFNNKRIEKDGVKVTEQVLITPQGADINTTMVDIGINVSANNGMLHINTNRYINDTLVIYNISGQIVYNVNLSVGKIDIAIPNGVYIIRTGEVTEKILVQ